MNTHHALWNHRLILLATLLLALIPASLWAQEEADPPEIVNGERLFLETRFAQFFFANSGGNANFVLTEGDPVLDRIETGKGTLAGPFAGKSMNCRACHLVDELVNTDEQGEFIPDDRSNVLMKTYTDFAVRSPVPDRLEDDATVAARNSPPLVNASQPRSDGLSFHFDGEFASMENLVIATLTGRNYGWLAIEFLQSVGHIAHVIRNDDGQGELAQEFGGISYMDLLTRTDLDPEFQLPAKFLISPTATDQEIVEAVARIISAYVTDLAFSQDDDGNFNLSPYDKFLELNKLPQQPANGESNLDYSKRLLKQIEQLEETKSLKFIRHRKSEPFLFHRQPFRFGKRELRGLKLFFALPDEENKSADTSGVGNCIACHAAPNFTDFGFHNTGATQKEFDRLHGDGAFINLKVPDLPERNQNYDRYLPATPVHPNATGRFRSPPSSNLPGNTDLGMWNVFANPDMPEPQWTLWKHLCVEQIGDFKAEDLTTDQELLIKVYTSCQFEQLLPTSLATFKTSGLRDLGHSAPYFHNGQERTLRKAVKFYQDMSDLARDGKLRNGAPELKDIHLDDSEVRDLFRFLKALNEDYS